MTWLDYVIRVMFHEAAWHLPMSVDGVPVPGCDYVFLNDFREEAQRIRDFEKKHGFVWNTSKS